MKRTIIIAILACLGFAALGAAIYANTLESPFLFDSSARILDNPNFRIGDLSLDNLEKAAFRKPGLKSRPVANVTFALNYLFNGYDTTGYHVINIVIHIVNGLLLLVFLTQTLALSGLNLTNGHRHAVAMLAALIWFANPLHTQSVTYIVQRANSMAALFYMLAFCLYIHGRRKGIAGQASWPWFACAVPAWLLALGCKQNAAILPLFILLYEWFFFQGLSWKWIRKHLPLMALVAVALVVVALVFLGNDPLTRLTSLHAFSKAQFTYAERILTQPRVIVYYMSLFLFPHPGRLNIDYDYPLSTSLFDPVTTLWSLLLIVAALGAAVYTARRNRLLSFAILWYFGNLLIESSVIPLDIIFEHRTYIPSMLIPVMPTVWCFSAIRNKRIATALLLLPVGLFAFWTFERNTVWKDRITFWQDCVAKSPNKARPQFNLGAAFAEVENNEAAMKHYRRALALDPNYAEVHNNIGSLLAREGKWEQAEAEYRTAIADRKGFYKAQYNLGVALRMQGRYDEAVEQLNEAIGWNPDFAEAYLNLGIIFDARSNSRKAFDSFHKAIELDPDLAAAHAELGKLYAKRGDIAKAEYHSAKALEIEPSNSDALLVMGNLLKAKGDRDGARRHYQQVLASDPENAFAHNNLAGLLFEMGDIDAAEAHYQDALRIDDSLVEAHVNLGGLLAGKGQLNQAMEHYTRAIDLDPTYAKAYYYRGNLFAKREDYEKAIADYREATRLDPSMDDARTNLGIALLRQGDAAGAEQAFRTALAVNPSNERAREGLAALRSSDGSAAAPSPETLHRKAVEYAGRGEYDQAIRLFKQIIERMPSEPGTSYNIACMYALKGDAAAAMDWLEKAVDSGYDNWDAIESDPDLNGIRQTARFKALLKKR